MCPSLTLQQLYRLTEYHHDDWLTSGQNSNTVLLLERIKQIVDSFGLVRHSLNKQTLMAMFRHRTLH